MKHLNFFTVISYLIKKRYSQFGDAFVNHVCSEILGSEKMCRSSFPWYLSSFFPPFPSPLMKRFEEALISQRAGKPLPEMVNISLTTQCPHSCWHCSTHSNSKSGDYLDTEAIKEVIASLIEAGCYHIGFTGGEPLLHPDLRSIISSCRKMVTTTLYTTGFTMTETMIKELKKSGLTTIMVSLDHSDGAKHDQLRGSPGSFLKALDTILLSKRSGFITGVSTVATANRIESGELELFLRWMKGLKVEEVLIFEPAPSGRLKNQSEVILDEQIRQKLISLHHRANNSRLYPRTVALTYVESKERMGCQAGNTRFYIRSDGNVTPCDFTPLSFGSIYHEPIMDIIGRMQKYFSTPRANCFFLANHKEIASLQDGTNPVTADASCNFCNTLKKSEYPRFYETLTEGQ